LVGFRLFEILFLTTLIIEIQLSTSLISVGTEILFSLVVECAELLLVIDILNFGERSVVYENSIQAHW
jgi:hypothetical protein